MSNRFLFQLLVVCLLCGQNAFSQPAIDVLHYKFQIELSDSSDKIKGKAEISIKFSKDASFFTLNLETRKKDQITMTDIMVYENNNRVFFWLVEEDENSIFIRPDNPIKQGETRNFTIVYSCIPLNGLIISKNKYGERTFFSDNWPDRAHHWIPCIDDPADKASLEFIVIAPSHYTVISNGIKMEEKEIGNGKKLTHWKEDTPLPTKIMVIGVARFAVKKFEDSPADIPVSAWVYPQDSTEGFRNYSPAPSILKFLSGYIGPYPFEKLANVQSKTMFGGMENASAIFYSESSAVADKTIESLLAHEIAHQWFGDMASEKSFPHLWLSEGFATYLTHIYIESKYGTDSLNNEMKKDRTEVITFAKESDRPVVDSVSPPMQLLNTNSYQKGGWILHMLRRQLGDSVFHTIIRSYYAAYAGKNADTRDFQKICEAESGKDLSMFFDQWLYTPGLPKIEVKWKYDSKKKSIFLTVKQMHKKLFKFPLDVQIQAASGKSKWVTLSITRQTQQFSIPVKEKPAKLYLDPKTSLLFEGSVSLIK